MIKSNSNKIDLYRLYELAVQDPRGELKRMVQMYHDAFGKKPRSFREDFCGTFFMSSIWVKLHPKNTALALDINPTPLSYGERVHRKKLTNSQNKRLNTYCGSVLMPPKEKVDLIAASNFSYFAFKDRDLLKNYFSKVYQTLKKGGIFTLDHMGGPDLFKKSRDKNDVSIGKRKVCDFYWIQESFEPLSNEALFSMTFKIHKGPTLRRVFTYDWRLWSIREIRELLLEVGFDETRVYWEGDDGEGGGNGIFKRTEKEEPCDVWIDYIVGIKK